MKISFYFIFVLLSVFGLLFFTTEQYLPSIKKWKSAKLLMQSKVYHDSSIDNASGLLQDGLSKSRIAHLLDPKNQKTEENYIDLLFKVEPTKALQKLAESTTTKENVGHKTELLRKCLQVLKSENLVPENRAIILSIAFHEADILENDKNWNIEPDNVLLVSELLIESGFSEKANERISKLLEQNPLLPRAIFFKTKLLVHLNDSSAIGSISAKLAYLSTRRNEIGIEAIRHLTLLHLLMPLSNDALERCISLLRSNPYSEPIDFLRVYALIFSTSKDSISKQEIIANCADLFELNQTSELIIFSSWLAKLGAFEFLIHYLPASKAKTDLELFKLRMNALAQIGDTESIYEEVNKSPIIPSVWRLVVQARAYAIGGKYDHAKKTFDRLLPLLGDDPRIVRSVCAYLEAANDLTSLAHVLEKLIEQPMHQKYSLNKLIQYRSASASLEKLLNWMTKLKDMRKQDPSLENAFLYFKLLNKNLLSPSRQLSELVEQALSQSKNWQSNQSQITLALAYLRDNEPDKALVALGEPSDWRKWASERPAWAFISSQVYLQNHDSEKSLLLSKNVNFEKMDRAERESLQSLFLADPSETMNE